jgi:hypothetical protein
MSDAQATGIDWASLLFGGIGAFAALFSVAMASASYRARNRAQAARDAAEEAASQASLRLEKIGNASLIDAYGDFLRANPGLLQKSHYRSGADAVAHGQKLATAVSRILAVLKKEAVAGDDFDHMDYVEEQLRLIAAAWPEHYSADGNWTLPSAAHEALTHRLSDPARGVPLTGLVEKILAVPDQ